MDKKPYIKGGQGRTEEDIKQSAVVLCACVILGVLTAAVAVIWEVVLNG